MPAFENLNTWKSGVGRFLTFCHKMIVGLWAALDVQGLFKSHWYTKLHLSPSWCPPCKAVWASMQTICSSVAEKSLIALMHSADVLFGISFVIRPFIFYLCMVLCSELAEVIFSLILFTSSHSVPVCESREEIPNIFFFLTWLISVSASRLIKLCFSLR